MVKVSGIVSRRGARAIAPEDLLFLLRHDVNRSARLKEFLSWKDVRKNAKATSGTEKGSVDASGQAGASGGGDEEVGDDSALVAEIEEDAKNLAASETNSSNYFEGNSSEFDSSTKPSNKNNQTTPSAGVQIGPKRRQLGLFWDLGHGLLADLPGNSGFTDFGSLTSYDSREQSTCQRETLRRLRHADLLTFSMSQSEYLEYSECRQASFTYKKARKFREWLVGGTARPGSLALATLAGGSARDMSRLNDDTLEILGFISYEIVQKLTEVSLAVKFEQEGRKEMQEKLEKQSKFSPSNANSSLGGLFTTNPTSTAANVASSALATTPATPATPVTPKTPIQVQHVEEAFRKLISSNIDGFNLFRNASNKKRKFIL